MSITKEHLRTDKRVLEENRFDTYKRGYLSTYEIFLEEISFTLTRGYLSTDERVLERNRFDTAGEGV